MTYLQHHGILGQKWGVRRYQNPDGTLTETGKKRYGIKNDKFTTVKGARKYFKDNQNDYFNKSIAYENEYDSTEVGAEKLKKYKKAVSDFESPRNFSEKEMDRFNEIEKDYLINQQRYVAQKLISEYGEEKATVLANRGFINTGKNAVQALEDEWRVHAL